MHRQLGKDNVTKMLRMANESGRSVGALVNMVVASTESVCVERHVIVTMKGGEKHEKHFHEEWKDRPVPL